MMSLFEDATEERAFWHQYELRASAGQPMEDDDFASLLMEVKYECALQLSDQNPEKWSRLKNVGSLHRGFYAMHHNDEDLRKATLAYEGVVKCTPDGHECRADNLNDLGELLCDCFERFGNALDINRSISVLEDAVRLTPEGHANRSTVLSSLGSSLVCRFECTEDLADIDRAISLQEEAVRLTPDGQADRPSRLYNLGTSLTGRFKRSGNPMDIDRAVLIHEEVIQLTPEGDADKHVRLNHLGDALHSRFGHTGDLTDINRAISVYEDSIHLTPASNDASRAAILNNLGISLTSRFERSGNLIDVDRAILAHEDAARLNCKGDASKSLYLNNLGLSFTCRFEHAGNIRDLNKAILVQEDAVHLTPEGHISKPGYLMNLGVIITTRFEHTGDLADIDRAISLNEDAVRLTPEGHSDKPGCLNSLGTSLSSRFRRIGDIIDIDRAISAHEEAVRLTPTGHVNKPARLNSLGNSFNERFKHTGDHTDIERAIALKEDAVRLTPEDHASKPIRLGSLATSLAIRFERFGNLVDLDRAISLYEDAFRLTPERHASRFKHLNNLGILFIRRFQISRDVMDIDKAIMSLEDAVRLSPDGDPQKATTLNALGGSYMSRFIHSGDIGDIDKAIPLEEYTVSLTPEGHPDRPGRLNNLGKSLAFRYEHTNHRDHFNAAISHYRLAANEATGPPSVRIEGALRWARLAFPDDASLSLEGYAAALDLLPRVAWLGQTISARYEELASIGDLANESAAAAIASRQYTTALEWLEQGRSIVWGQLLNLRTPVDALHDVEPSLADELMRISKALEQATTRDSYFLESSQQPSLEHASQRQHRLAEEWESLVTKAQAVPGFEDFLRPKKLVQLLSAARSGPVVVINVHKRRCDALVLIAGRDDVLHVPLAHFSFDRAQQLQKSMRDLLTTANVRMRDVRASRQVLLSGGTGFDGILSELWSNVVKPVLDGLELSISHAHDPPRIIWCTTGPLAFLPIHAAGIYDNAHGEAGFNIFDFVCSSYTPTLTAIVEPPSISVTRGEFRGLLAVSQPNTPGLSSLPNTEAEMIEIQRHAHAFPVRYLKGPAATVKSVFTGMEDCSWVHFACHALQDPTRPTESAFCCYDGHLELSKIITKSFQHAGFAFLSACQTAAGDEKLSEEAVHLAAGMLLAGYRGVIATMWSIKDEDAPVIAGEVYSQLFSGTAPDSMRAAHALHRAVKRLREQVGNRAFLSWVPYIHVGM